MFKFLKLSTLFIVLTFVNPVSGQSKSFFGKITSSLKKRQQRKDSTIAVGGPFLSIFAGPGYTPESGALLGGGLLYTFSTNRANKNLQRSSIPLLGSISTRGNITLGSIVNTFWLDNKLRARMAAKFSNVRADYFGIGYENNAAIEKGEDTSEYNRTFYQVEPKIEYQILPNLYGGIAFMYSNFDVKETNPIMAIDPNYIEFGPKIRESGVFYSLTFDSRDIVVNAYKGAYISFSYYNATDKLGGNQNFEAIELDARYYKTLNRPGNLLAAKLYTRKAMGHVPYSAMTLIGSTDLLRGYLNGLYRDKSGMAFIGEWRYMFLNKMKDMSKVGLVTWLGTGSIGNSFDDFQNWLPNGGVGFRYEVQPRMNVRVDFGIGKNSTGLYFNFSEAF
ncbi:BamA/TamA family outer membrane protein [Tamlana fucoidanivorans]|uniref:Bacterial surface antigen (D15) domain-containing protein n=1 Tax=Allotamlana fucoidanivorans TaxID=2583814 RepID=A0A5C4SKE6_9FLAO|nr:BamA/TamA family outer membrane protein [Tamlana fucoidanivorans]TNJ44309.1 hypothetical protein FGF67_09790 [Tamlana fucoidanivorans]